MLCRHWFKNLASRLGLVLVHVATVGALATPAVHAGTVIDGSFDAHVIDNHSGTVDYAYSADGGAWVDGYAPAVGGNSAWTSRGTAGGAWIYNSAYAVANGLSAPRTGDQAITSSTDYTYQVLDDVFTPNTRYTFGIYSAIPSGSERLYMYIYNGTDIVDGGGDSNSLATSGSISTTGVVDQNGIGTWHLSTLVYETGATGDEIGDRIGVSFWGERVHFDDASFTSAPITAVPEPTSLFLLALVGIFGGMYRWMVRLVTFRSEE